jgi:hypothetical protein
MNSKSKQKYLLVLGPRSPVMFLAWEDEDEFIESSLKLSRIKVRTGKIKDLRVNGGFN